MNILYVSTACSSSYLQYLYDIAIKKPHYSIQKFHRLLMQGFVENGCEVDTVSSIPCSPSRYAKKVFCPKGQKENGIKYHYMRCLNIRIIKNLCDFGGSFFFTLIWCLKHRKGIVVCDILNVSVTVGAWIASKACHNHLSAIVTDMPGMMVGADNQNHKSSMATKIMMAYINRYNSYILLTEQMNERINLKKRPYIIMEGLVDSTMSATTRSPQRNPRIAIYAGGLHERYGIKMLVDAFDNLSAKMMNVELHLYGEGPMISYIQEVAKRNKAIVFHGAVTNNEVVDAELRATLLINPRPTHEDFTKYSFPSKNMEYMVSGTPVLTTKLPGMPLEYYPYIYLFNEETTKDYEGTLRTIFSLSNEELDEKGRKAQQFVLEMKNNVFQAKRILELYNID